MAAKRAQPRVAILGCGAVGRALAVELLRCGERGGLGKLRVWSRSPRSVRRLEALVRKLDPPKARRLARLQAPGAAWAKADVVLLCVADGALAAVARELARAAPDLRGKVALFTNGYLPVDTLAPLRRRGCAVARLHPLASIPSGREEAALSYAFFALEGDPRALRIARDLVRKIDGRTLSLRARREAARSYHAAASLLGGGLVALLHLTEQAMAPSVSSRRDVREALHEFAFGVLWNASILGPEAALTGALARGSEPLVRGHLRALRRVPDAALLYRWLGGPMVELARSRGSLDALQASRLYRLLARREVRARIRAGRMARRSR